MPLLLNAQPEIAERAIRALDLKGDVPNMIDSTEQLSITVEDLTAPEYEWLRRGYRQCVAGAPAAAAGNFSGVVLGTLTPQNSVLAVIRRFRLYNFAAAAQNFRWAVIQSTAWAGFTLVNSFPAVCDSRSLIAAAGIPSSQFKVFTGNLAVNPVASGCLVGLPAGGVADIKVPIILSDTTEFGTAASPAFMLFVDAANVSFHLEIEYSERLMMQSEAK